MSLLNSLFSGVSGIRNHQAMMDNIGNNIANVNTLGYKSTRVTFSDTFNQFVRFGSDPTDSNGGTSAFQIGLGMKVNSIDRNWNQGTFERTGLVTDLALQGDALFALENNGERFYSRAGSFTFDSDGNLVNNQNGATVLGKNATADGVIPPGNNLEKIIVNKNERIPAVATTDITWAGNLDSTKTVTASDLYEQSGNIRADRAVGEVVQEFNTIYNSYGDEYKLTTSYEKTGADAWNMTYEIQKLQSDGSYGAAVVTSAAATPITFVPGTGDLSSPASIPDISDSTESLSFTLDISKITQNSAAETISSNVDANREPTLVDGTLSVFDSLGNTHTLTVRFTKLDESEWAFRATVPDESGTLLNNVGTVSFGIDGSITSVAPATPILSFNPTGGASTQNIELDFGSGFDGITQTSSDSVVSALSQNGSDAATLADLSLDQYGNIIGVFSNGNSRKMAQILLAKFPNNSGLTSVGDNMYTVGANAGTPIIGDPGEVTGTTIQSGALEQSNVDLSEQFTKMIVAQRGFQANARVVTVSDQLLQEITNLVR
ncbi:MAG: flagellar hook protein FlgE [Melioribacteraceae bacterium]|nr:flagellar hook protein FlgE [Melioribacteraceae bacterium]